MSTETHGHEPGQRPHHKDVSFESSDVQTRTIYIYLISLAISVMATFFVCIYIERAAMKYSLDSETQMAPSRAAMGSTYTVLPPEPRLQTDPQQDLRNMREEARDANESYGWVDKNSGLAQIPVSEAMKIIAQRGTAGGTVGGTAAPEEKKAEAKKTEPKKAAQKK